MIKPAFTWSDGNAKMSNMKALSFPMPAVLTCPGAGACKTNCYATQGRYQCPSVQRPRLRNFVKARDILARFGAAKLTQILSADLLLYHRFKIIRVHDSGDFWRQDYLDAWQDVINGLKDKRFYCYTKSHQLDWSRTPPNFSVVHSFGSSMDHLINTRRPHSRVFRSMNELLDAGYTPGFGTDAPALGGVRRVGLVYHGTRKLIENGFVR